jgi:hypothetical protein
MTPEKAVSEGAEASRVCAGVASSSSSPLCAVAATTGRPSPLYSPAAEQECLLCPDCSACLNKHEVASVETHMHSQVGAQEATSPGIQQSSQQHTARLTQQLASD